MTTTAPIPLDLQKAAKESLGFECGRGRSLRQDGSPMRLVTSPSSTA